MAKLYYDHGRSSAAVDHMYFIVPYAHTGNLNQTSFDLPGVGGYLFGCMQNRFVALCDLISVFLLHISRCKYWSNDTSCMLVLPGASRYCNRYPGLPA